MSNQCCLRTDNDVTREENDLLSVTSAISIIFVSLKSNVLLQVSQWQLVSTVSSFELYPTLTILQLSNNI